MGVVEMYRATGNPRYLELSKNLIDIRGMVENGTDDNQDRILSAINIVRWDMRYVPTICMPE